MSVLFAEQLPKAQCHRLTRIIPLRLEVIVIMKSTAFGLQILYAVAMGQSNTLIFMKVCHIIFMFR